MIRSPFVVTVLCLTFGFFGSFLEYGVVTEFTCGEIRSTSGLEDVWLSTDTSILIFCFAEFAGRGCCITEQGPPVFAQVNLAENARPGARSAEDCLLFNSAEYARPGVRTTEHFLLSVCCVFVWVGRPVRFLFTCVCPEPAVRCGSVRAFSRV